MQPYLGFWGALKKPIFVLAPLANVTDAVFRAHIIKYSKPAVIWTEVGADPVRGYSARDFTSSEDFATRFSIQHRKEILRGNNLIEGPLFDRGRNKKPFSVTAEADGINSHRLRPPGQGRHAMRRHRPATPRAAGCAGSSPARRGGRCGRLRRSCDRPRGSRP